MNRPVDPSRDLIGAWKLTALQFEFADSGERVDLFGQEPLGRILVTEGGDFMTVITSSDRAALSDAAQLFKTMMAYAGKFRIEGDKLVIRCDVSWHPVWAGTEQVRFFSLDGDRLTLRSPKQAHPQYPDRLGHGVIDWQRER